MSEAVAVVVPTTNLSADSSHAIMALSPVDPLSIMIPESLAFEPAPLFNSNKLSSKVVFVEFTVVVVPLTVKFPVTVTAPPNVAAPASDISKVKAVISEPPSLPLKIISLSDTADLTTKSVDEFVNLPNSVPASFRITSPPSASITISVTASIVKSPVASISELVNVVIVWEVVVPLTTPLIVGAVKVLFVNVSDPVNETKLSPCKAVLNSAKEPVTLLPVPPKSSVLFVNVAVDEAVMKPDVKVDPSPNAV